MHYLLYALRKNMSDNYNDMIRDMGYNPDDPDHLDQMQGDFYKYPKFPKQYHSPRLKDLKRIEHEQRNNPTRYGDRTT